VLEDLRGGYGQRAVQVNRDVGDAALVVGLVQDV